MSELAALITRRGQLKAQLTRLANYIRDNTENPDIDQIKIRVEKATETWDDFQQVENQIEEETGANDETERYRGDFEELYYDNMAKCSKIIRNTSSDCSSNSSSNGMPNKSNTDEITRNSPSSLQSVQSTIKLAALDIPKFSGSYTEWAAFYDIYIALIHNNKALTDVQKFFYLRSSLSGDAEKVIQCLQTTSENYQVAWENLKARYDNKKVLIQVHVKALFDLEPIKKESSIYLSTLVDTLSSHLKALESLGQTPQNWGALLLFLITSKLDTNTRREWESESSKTEAPDVLFLIDFLKSRFRILEAIESVKYFNTQTSKDTPKFKKLNDKSSAFTTIGTLKCYNCNGAHSIYKCSKFLALSIYERINKISDLKLCKICLRSHEGEKCTSRRCPKCARPHNGLLHLPRFNNDNQTSNSNSNINSFSNSNSRLNTTAAAGVNNMNADNDTSNSSPPVSINAHAYRKNKLGQVLLSTAEIIAYDYHRKPVLCRVLLDSGSQHNFITESMTRRLNLKRIKTSCSVIGINEASHTSSYKVSINIKSCISDYSLNLEFFALPKLTSKLPLMPVNLNELKIPVDIRLADPSFNRPKSIDMILGAEIYFDLLTKEQIQPIPRGPILQNTRLGWVIAGPIPLSNIQSGISSVSLFTSVSSEIANLEKQMAEFWRLEEIKNDEVYTVEEKMCKQHFELNVRRDEDGRFTVVLPFRDTVKLGKSYDVALRRFLFLERRFQSDINLKEEYVKFMNEYISLGHMELAQHTVPENRCYYLPHHAVRKESSSSTKLRVVFDASAKTNTNVSLNDVLLKGPCIQEELVSIMTRFRTHKYVITADIKKMYRQIWVSESQRDYQRILWRENPHQPLNIYRLKTVTYGVITASYLATACLKRLSEEESSNFTEACQALSRDFYVDDFLGGAASKQDALKLRDDLIIILKNAGLELCKWSSNDPELLIDVEALPDRNNEQDLSSVENITKILGLYWNRENDAYQYKVLPYNKQARNTKRVILSEIASIFDPLGLISPVVIRFKIIMQKLWQLHIDWDTTLPFEIENEWQKCRANLIHLNSLVIKRSLIGNGDIIDIELHGFADASLTSYGACLYLRVRNTNGEITTNLICSKSRVAPLKTVSLPRLELLAAVLLTRLSVKYASSLRLPIERKYYWSDSTIVLSWISSESSRWKTFVAHRIGEIHESTSISQWRHVSTKDNPADIVSRGCCPTQINNLDLWWKGPQWLAKDFLDWPNSKNNVCQGDKILMEERTVSHVIFTTRYDFSILEKYSSLTKLTRVVAYCRRFAHNASKNEKLVGTLRVSEMEEATLSIIKLVQASSFEREILDLQKSNQVHSKSKLLRLRPFLDKNGLIRVGGRLENASTLEESQRHPIILPAKGYITKLIFRHEHEKSMHGGPQFMLSSVRLKYWPLNGRNIARDVVHRCVKCFKYKPVVVQPIMGDLPKSRVHPERAFKRTGVDFAGPFYIKTSLRRNAPKNKAYACLFVCFTTKAVHIELVGDLSTQAFLKALQRFCDRRGLCTDIYSDNATNFVGANYRLQDLNKLFKSALHQEQVQNTLTKSNIQWHFIPPRSPHFGGLWEAAVKAMKSHLYRTLGNASLTFEELNTVLIRVEAILNSRPITPISSHPSDLSALTPGHFLIGDSLNSLPERDETNIPTNRLTRWRRVVQFTQQLWTRWTRDYLTQLQERSKWSTSTGPHLKIGTVVLIRDDNAPPLQWSIGKVLEVTRGSDDRVRVAQVQTNKGVFKRAVQYLCPLPFEGNQSNQD